jgi:hypothetical protein
MSRNHRRVSAVLPTPAAPLITASSETGTESFRLRTTKRRRSTPRAS